MVYLETLKKTRGWTSTAAHFLELSLGVLKGLEKNDINPRSEARGEGRERGNLIGTIFKSPVAQMTGGLAQDSLLVPRLPPAPPFPASPPPSPHQKMQNDV